MSWQPPQQPNNPFMASANVPPGMNSGPTRRSNASGGSANSGNIAGNYGNINQPPSMAQRRSNAGSNSGFNQQPPQMRPSFSGSGSMGNAPGFNNPRQPSGLSNQNSFQGGYGGQSDVGYGSPGGGQYDAYNSFQPNAGFNASGSSFPSRAGFSGPQQPQQPPAFGQQPGGQQFFGQQQLDEFQKSAAGQLGMQLGTAALKEGQSIVNQNLSRVVNIPKLKYYFNVSNSYVLNKLRVLVFSFRQKSWTRLVVRSESNGQMEGFKPPREDLNAPDLYIPIMAFVTYVLLVGITLNSRKKFEPEVLGMTSSTALVIVAFEVLLFKFCCYLFNVVNEVPFLDLIAYCGYKFVPVLLCLTLNLILPPNSVAVFALLGYLIISFSFFTLRSIKYLVLPESTTTTVMPVQRQQRIYLLFGFVAIQALTSFFLFYI